MSDVMTTTEIREFIKEMIPDDDIPYTSVEAIRQAIADKWINDAQEVSQYAYSEGCYQQSFADNT